MLSAKNHIVFVLLVGLGTGAGVTGKVELHLSGHVILILVCLLNAIVLTPGGNSKTFYWSKSSLPESKFILSCNYLLNIK